MRGADTLIPSRFLSLIGHFCVMVSLLWDSKKNVLHCLPSQYHDSHYQIYLSRLTTGLAVAIALILIELTTFIFGLTMFSPSVSLTSIFCHGSASILFTYFILDGWTCAWFWPLFIFCSVLPFCVDFVVAFITTNEHEHLTAGGPPSGWSFYLVLAALVTTLGSSLPVGYNIGVINTPAANIQKFCNSSFWSRYGVQLDEGSMNIIWSSVVAIFIVGGCTGSILGSVLADKLGRKKATILTNLLSIAGAALFCACRAANSVEMLVLGRLLVGLSGGLTTSIVPMYLTELSPAGLTGTMGAACPVGVNVGVLVGQVMGLDFLLGGVNDWPYLLSAFVVLVIICLPILFFLPESPKYLYVVKKRENEALNELSRLRGVSSSALVEDVESLKEESRVSSGGWGMCRALRSPRLRLPLMLVCALQAGQQTSGINAVFYYSQTIFENAGATAQVAAYATVACGAVNVCTAVGLARVLPTAGRRPLLLASTAAAAVLLTALAASIAAMHYVWWMSYVCMSAVVAYVFVYGLGLGPIPYFIASEIFEVAPRGAGMAWGSLANWGGNFLVGMCFPSLRAAIGPACFLIFAGTTAALFCFVKVYFPETRGKSPTHVTELCARGLASRPLLGLPVDQA